MEQTTIIDCYETKLKSEPQYENGKLGEIEKGSISVPLFSQ